MHARSIEVVYSLDDHHKRDLVALYKNEFWCNKRELRDVEKMLDNTDIVIGVVNAGGGLIGFVRVLTDYIYKTTIYDLIVHPEYRHKGIGALLMDEVVNHPRLSDVGTIDLNCPPEMNRFYEKWEFTTNLDDLTFMRRFHKKFGDEG